MFHVLYMAGHCLAEECFLFCSKPCLFLRMERDKYSFNKAE